MQTLFGELLGVNLPVFVRMEKLMPTSAVRVIYGIKELEAAEAEAARIQFELEKSLSSNNAPDYWIIEQQALAAQAVIDARNELIRLKKLKTDTQ